MKTLLVIFLLTLTAASFAMSKQEFMKLDDVSKREFLVDQTTEFYEEKDLHHFQNNHSDLMNMILKRGLELSNIWGDTILEGPYTTTGDVETTISVLYVYKGEIYAIGATVSAPAINTDSCEYDEDAGTWPEDCDRGSITEPFIVDTEGNIIDFGDYAEFYN